MGIFKFEKVIRVKLCRLWHRVWSRLSGNARRANFHMQQRRLAGKMLSLSLDCQRRQSLYRSLKQVAVCSREAKARRRCLPGLLRLVGRLQSRRLRDGFQRISSCKGAASQHSESQQSQLSLPLDPNDPRRLKTSSSAKFARKPSQSQGSRPEPQPQPLLSDRPAEPNKELEDFRKMSLSAECREALTRMQRFDKFVYSQESENTLKGPVEVELRRLEKVKNSDRTLRNTFFDTELSINVLYNHIRTLGELARELQEKDAFKDKIKELEDKVIQNNVQKQKEIKELTERLRGKPQPGGGQEGDTKLRSLEAELREHRKLNEVLYQNAKDFEKLKRVLEVQIKKHQVETGKELSLDRKEMVEFIHGIVCGLRSAAESPPTEPQTGSSVSLSYFHDFKADLRSLLTEQASTEKSLSALERQRKTCENREADPRRSELAEAYAILSGGNTYLSSLHASLRAKNQELSELGKRVQDLERDK